MRSGTFGHVGMWRLRTLLLGGALIQLSQGAQHGLLVVAAHHLVALRGDERASVPLHWQVELGAGGGAWWFLPSSDTRDLLDVHHPNFSQSEPS